MDKASNLKGKGQQQDQQKSSEWGQFDPPKLLPDQIFTQQFRDTLHVAKHLPGEDLIGQLLALCW